MPNKKAKRRKYERREKNRYLQQHGRTPAQIKRKRNVKNDEKGYNSHFDEDLQFGEKGQKWLLWLADEAQVEVKTERDKWYDTGTSS